jgi:transcriptional regulator with XRE-family HTH domain
MGRGRPPKAAEPTTPGGEILADNIRARAAVVFSAYPNETDWIDRLARRANVGNETVRRMVKGIGSPRLDNVESIANALGVSLTDLLGASGVPTSAPGGAEEGALRRRSHR